MRRAQLGHVNQTQRNVVPRRARVLNGAEYGQWNAGYTPALDDLDVDVDLVV